MARVKLTDRFCSTVKATGPQTEYFDATTRGLALRVTPSNKAWTVHYTRAGKRARLPLVHPSGIEGLIILARGPRYSARGFPA
jgi:hypothetical protein